MCPPADSPDPRPGVHDRVPATACPRPRARDRVPASPSLCVRASPVPVPEVATRVPEVASPSPRVRASLASASRGSRPRVGGAPRLRLRGPGFRSSRPRPSASPPGLPRLSDLPCPAPSPRGRDPVARVRLPNVATSPSPGGGVLGPRGSRRARVLGSLASSPSGPSALPDLRAPGLRTRISAFLSLRDSGPPGPDLLPSRACPPPSLPTAGPRAPGLRPPGPGASQAAPGLSRLASRSQGPGPRRPASRPWGPGPNHRPPGHKPPAHGAISEHPDRTGPGPLPAPGPPTPCSPSTSPATASAVAGVCAGGGSCLP